MSRFLAEMEAGSRRRLEDARRIRPFPLVEEEAGARLPARSLAGFGARFDLIAEIKPRSPARGRLPDRDPVAQAEQYLAGGAAMLSVLTEPDVFGGSLPLLERVSGFASLPVMRKDFLVDPYQVYEARAAGADGVLLVGRLLDDASLGLMLAAVRELDMFALLEAFHGDELDRLAAAPGAHLLGVNCRDLDTLRVEPDRHGALAGKLPIGRVTVAESGAARPEDTARLAGMGYGAVLVGTALMEADEPSALVAALVEAGRGVGAVTR